MKATKLTYSKMFNLGSYEHEEISIEIEIEAGETAQQVLDKAKEFVERQHSDRHDAELEKYMRIVANPDDYTGRHVKEAQAYIDCHHVKKEEELPF